VNSRTRLALARVQVTDVVRLLNRRLNAAGYHGAAGILLNSIADVAEEIATQHEQDDAREPQS